MGASGVVTPPPEPDVTARRPSNVEEETPEASLPRRLLAEALGTFFLTFAAAGGEVVAALSKGEVSAAAKAVAPGLVIMAFVYSLGDVSGAHFNPAVTLAFALRGVFRWSGVPAYWAAQLGAAAAAAALLRVIFGDVAHVGANHVGLGTAAAGYATEALLSLLLVTVILNTATRARVVGPNAAIAVGGTIALCGLFAGPVTGASMNPARSLGPALVAGYLHLWWIYVAGPLTGAVVAVLATHVLHPVRDSDEIDAAQGEHERAPSLSGRRA